jgi:hypothetical protein
MSIATVVLPISSAAARRARDDLSFSPGDCVTWIGQATTDNVEVVDCSTPHVMEMTGSSIAAPGRPFPSKDRWHELIKTLCTPVVDRYLDHSFDPNGRYSVGALRPAREVWAMGDHKLRCSIASKVRTSGDHNYFTGRVDTTDQSFVYPVGTCLVESTHEVGRWTAGGCDGAHIAEVVGVVDLDGRFDHPPSDDEVVTATESECIMATAAYLGRPIDFTHDDLFPSLTPDAYGWNLGSRKINCLIGRSDDGQPVDLPGPLR